MIVTLAGIIALIVIILLLYKRFNNEEKDKEEKAILITTLIIFLGIPLALTTIIMGIFEPTKMSEWKVKEAIKPTLLSSEEENTFDGYTYQYIIPKRWEMNAQVINYTVNDISEDVPIMVKCERKAVPTIWTLGLGTKETKYILYTPNGTISYLPNDTVK